MASTGKAACTYGHARRESFWGSLQMEVLDRKPWPTRAVLANAIFEWIEAWYNPYRRHPALGSRASSSSRRFKLALRKRHDQPTETVHETRDRSCQSRVRARFSLRSGSATSNVPLGRVLPQPRRTTASRARSSAVALAAMPQPRGS